MYTRTVSAAGSPEECCAGFGWHQDNQNGPVSFQESLRFWICMDDTPADGPVPVHTAPVVSALHALGAC